MNLALLPGSADVVANGLYFVTFNQDATSLAVGTSTGYRLFTLNGHDKFDQTYEFTGITGFGLVVSRSLLIIWGCYSAIVVGEKRMA